MVCKLKKALNGVKQAPKAQYARFDRYMLQPNFKKGTTNSNVYFKVKSGKLLIVVVYVDDSIFGGDEYVLKKFAKEMQKEFEMPTIGELSFLLGRQVTQSEDGIFISRTKYIKEVLKKFGMDNSKLCGTPMVTSCHLRKDDESLEVDHKIYRSMIGGLLYLTASRPNIMHVVCLVARYQANPNQSHD